MLPIPPRRARCAFALAAAAALSACGTFVQVVDRDGAPVAGASVAPQWAFLGEWSTTDEQGWAGVHDLWLGLAWWLAPKFVVVRTANDVFHIPYPPPSPIRLPIASPPPAASQEASR